MDGKDGKDATDKQLVECITRIVDSARRRKARNSSIVSCCATSEGYQQKFSALVLVPLGSWFLFSPGLSCLGEYVPNSLKASLFNCSADKRLEVPQDPRKKSLNQRVSTIWQYLTNHFAEARRVHYFRQCVGLPDVGDVP